MVLSRRLMEGRSTSKINGETVPISLLKEAAGILIDIHGQHEHQSLLYKKKQLEILDNFAADKIQKTAEQVKAAYAEYKNGKKSLNRRTKMKQSVQRNSPFWNLK